MIYYLIFASLFYSNWIGDCSVILDQYKYNFTGLLSQPIIKFNQGLDYYYLRLCSERSLESTTDILALQCVSNCKTCHSIASKYNVNYIPRNPQNFSEGVIFYAKSEPYSDDNGKTYKDLALKFDLLCDAASNGISNINISIDESIKTIVAKAYSSTACPIIVPSPSPTPEYQPYCAYSSRIKDNITFGLNEDFSILNQFPFGINTNLIIDGKSKVLFYQPCERIPCPLGYSCSTNDFSSAWLCEINGSERFCDSYGINNEDVDMHPIDYLDLNKGIRFHIKDETSNRSINLTLKCESDNFPKNKIKLSKNASIIQDTLLLEASSPNVCIKYVPTPSIVPPEVCQFNLTDSNTNNIFVDLGLLNNDNSGWTKTVIANSGSSRTESTLIYQPCGSMICPSDYYCDGDEDAQIWLCNGKNCIGYGLYKNNVTFSVQDSRIKDSFQVIHVNYQGSRGRNADIVFTCNKDLENNAISLPEEVLINENKLSFQIETKQVCSSLPIVDTSNEEISTFITENEEITSEFSPSDIITSEPKYSDSITINPTESELITEEPTSSDIITDNPTASDIITDEPTFSNTVIIYPTESEIITIEPTPSDIITSEPTASDLITSNPTPSDIITSEPTASDLVTSNPTASDIITNEPTASNFITNEPTLSSNSPTTQIKSESPCLTSDDIPITYEPTGTLDDNMGSDDKKSKSKFKLWMFIPIIILIGLFLYFVVGTIVVSIRDKSIHLPNRKFWRRCGKCMSKKEKEYTFKLISDSD